MRRALPLLLLALVGCGGGGKHSTGSSGSSVTFAANSIVYGVANGTDADFDVSEVTPGGTPKRVVAGVDGAILAFAKDPSQASRYVLAADPEGTGLIGLYLSKNLSLANAKPILTPTLTSISTLVFAPDGKSVVVAASGGLGTVDTTGLYVDYPFFSFAVGNGATLAPDGVNVAYVGPVPGGDNEGDYQVLTRNLAAANQGEATVTPLTTTGNHALPAFSSDGTRLAYWTLADGANALTVLTVATGATVTIPGVAAFEPQGVAFSPDGATLAIVGQSGANGVIATAPADGSAAPTTIVSSSLLLGNYGFFWTDANGRATAGGRSGLGVSRAHSRRKASIFR